MSENFFESWLMCNGWINTGEKYGDSHEIYRTYGGARIDLHDDGIMLFIGPARVKFPYEGIHVDAAGVLWLSKEAFIFPGKSDDLFIEGEENVTT
jgi:hypothetical protein